MSSNHISSKHQAHKEGESIIIHDSGDEKTPINLSSIYEKFILSRQHKINRALAYAETGYITRKFNRPLP